MTTSRRRLTAFVLAGALLAGACSEGGEEQAAENPKQALTDALDALAEYEGITAEISVEADTDALVEEDTPPEVAEAIVNSSLVISGKGSTPEDTQFEMRVNVDGNEDAVAFRVVGTSLYARAEVAEMVEAFGGDMASIDAAVQQASAMGFDFAQAVVDGEWVGVEDVDKLAEQFGLPVQTPDPEQAAALQKKLVEIFEQNAEVTSEGTDDVGAHLVVSLPVRETLGDVFEAIETLGGVPAGSVPTPPLDDLPDGEIPLDVWVSDGRLVQLEADVVAIGEALGEEPPEDVGEFAFRITLDEFTGEVEAPDDFEAIDLQEIMQSVFGAAMGSESAGALGAGGGGREVVVPELGLACSDLAGVPPDQIKTFLEASGQPGAYKKVKQACPELF